MNQIATVLPVAVFLTAYTFFDLYFASALLAAALGVQTLHAHATRGRADAMLWVSFVLAGVCAVLALRIQDTLFLVGRASAMYWMVSAGLAIAYWVTGRNAIKILFEARCEAPARFWTQWLWLYVAVFALLGVVNLLIAQHFTEAIWVAFDTFGVWILLAGLVALHVVAMRRYQLVAPS